ncbi:NAD-dependent epimerase/dehydratase family protein [Clostridium algoriphilum]|uniref:NAD-dependent epimerase/dehydratase family protein n=1 Tax=Clostridium algoriphilum TaxID=198347 RepID=UPI001CF3E3C5|nr:NAD-dependent epimerase/dehydratase family protein [Clostridium algoriphilum]MCB2293935.1 NAD-dependent epimerase/dehydratase family protein [Clostridium algoriphilum]
MNENKTTSVITPKKILITGLHSYIGKSFQYWCLRYLGRYTFGSIDLRDDSWKEKSFSEYDAILYVAGIAHVSADPKMEALYYKVNRDLAIETANKAKNEGVKQFIFMSSIIVYGDSSDINKKKIINENTVPHPTNFYGNSKLQAEQGIFALQGDSFNVVALRPPMIYGNGSKGNYNRLVQMAQKLPVFPNVENERSMLHIDNLCEFISLMIENEEHGVFYPQNTEYVKTSEMVRLIAEAYGKRVRLTKLANPLLSLLAKRVSMVNKAFGNLVYEKSMSIYKENYCVRSLEESVLLTELVDAIGEVAATKEVTKKKVTKKKKVISTKEVPM